MEINVQKVIRTEGAGVMKNQLEELNPEQSLLKLERNTTSG